MNVDLVSSFMSITLNWWTNSLTNSGLQGLFASLLVCSSSANQVSKESQVQISIIWLPVLYPNLVDNMFFVYPQYSSF